jgi:hypothetical protein
MGPSAARVAHKALASRPGTVEDLIRTWLGEVGAETARLAGGDSRLESGISHHYPCR